MSSPVFNFPPESYSAVYTNDVSGANGVNGKVAVCGSVYGLSWSPDGTSPRSGLFSCFNCAFRNGIKAIRKNKDAAKNKAPHNLGLDEVSLDINFVELTSNSMQWKAARYRCIGVAQMAVLTGDTRVVASGKDEERWRGKEEGALFRRWRRSTSSVEPATVPAPTTPTSQPSDLLKFLAINALELSAPASDALLKSRSSEWFQLSGHPGSLAPAGPGTVWKRRSDGDHTSQNPERDAYEALAACPHMRNAIPRYYRELEYGGEHFIELQDLLHGFRDPHVMDIKMGTRTFLEDEVSNARARPDLYEKMVRLDPNAPTEAEHAARAVTKLRYMQFREQQSSSAEQGFRIEAVKLPGRPPLNDLQKVREPRQLKATIAKFLGNDERARHAIAARLREIRSHFEKSEFFRTHEIVGSSIFIIYDDERVGAWLIDFAKTRRVPEGMQVTHRKPWDQGNHEEGFLYGLDRLIETIETAKLSEATDTDVSR